jgi:hypothetical protein
MAEYGVPQNLFPLPTGSIFSLATTTAAVEKDHAGAIACFAERSGCVTIHS